MASGSRLRRHHGRRTRREDGTYRSFPGAEAFSFPAAAPQSSHQGRRGSGSHPRRPSPRCETPHCALPSAPVAHSDPGNPSALTPRPHSAGQRLGWIHGRRGTAGDNAAMESFCALRQENLPDRRWESRDQRRLAIIIWIERTDLRRRRLGKLTPPNTRSSAPRSHSRPDVPTGESIQGGSSLLRLCGYDIYLCSIHDWLMLFIRKAIEGGIWWIPEHRRHRQATGRTPQHHRLRSLLPKSRGHRGASALLPLTFNRSKGPCGLPGAKGP
jgi:hypothetical protein